MQRAIPGTPPSSSESQPSTGGLRTWLRQGLVLAVISLVLTAGLAQSQTVAAQGTIELLSSEVESRFPEGIFFRVAVVVGAVPEAALLQRVLTAAGRDDLLTEFVDAQAQERLGGPTTVVGR